MYQHPVAKLLNKLLAEQSKSRPRPSNDKGLAESKNGAEVRKHMGYTHIAAPHAEAIEAFYEDYSIPIGTSIAVRGAGESGRRKGKEKWT